MFIPHGAVGFKTRRDQTIVLGPALNQAPPVYPPALIARRLPPQQVCLRVAIGKRGHVYASAPLYATDGCPTANAVPAPFLAAAQAAVARWEFLPTHLCTFPKGIDASKQGTNCAAEGAKVQRLAISLAFIFTFSVEAGTPRATVQSLHPTQREP